jgi:hypothetical protein
MASVLSYLRNLSYSDVHFVDSLLGSTALLKLNASVSVPAPY